MVDEKQAVQDVLPDLATEAVVRRQKQPATLVQIGTRVVTSDGRFHARLATDYLLQRARRQWIAVAELAKIFGGGNTKAGKVRIRRNMSHVFSQCLNHGEFLVYDTGTNGRIEAVKLLDASSEHERKAVWPQLERMKQRNQLSSDKYEKALSVIQLREDLSAVPTCTSNTDAS